MAEPMYPSEVNAGVRGMMFGNEPAQSQPDAPSWSMGNDYSPSRFENGFYNRFQPSNNRNLVRSALNMGIRKGIDVELLRKQIEELKNEHDRLNQEFNTPYNIDLSRLTGLQNQYATNMAHAPMMQAPVQPQVNDTVAGVSALAALLSPQQMRGRIAMAPFQTAQMSADRQNQQNQQQYAIESQNFGTVMKGLAAQIDQEAEQVKNLYGVEVDKKELLRKRMNDIMDSVTQTQGQIVGAEKAYDANTIRRHTAATNEWKNAIAQAQLDGEVTQDEYDQLAGLLPNFLESRGIPVELADTYVMPTVGKSQSRMGMDFNQTRLTGLDKGRTTKQNFDVAFKAWNAYLGGLKEVGIVDQNDIDSLTEVRKTLSEKYGLSEIMFPLPKIGKSWHLVMAEASGARADNAANRQSVNDTVDRYFKKREADLKAFDTATEPLKSAFESEEKTHNSLAEEQRKAQQKFQESNSASDQTAWENARQAYQLHLPKFQAARDKYTARSQARTRLVQQFDDEYANNILPLLSNDNPAIPTNPNTRPPALTGTLGGGATLPDPRGGNQKPPPEQKANTGGGKPNPTQKTGKDKKPAKLTQDAKKAPPPPKQLNFEGQTGKRIN